MRNSRKLLHLVLFCRTSRSSRDNRQYLTNPVYYGHGLIRAHIRRRRKDTAFVLHVTVYGQLKNVRSLFHAECALRDRTAKMFADNPLQILSAER